LEPTPARFQEIHDRLEQAEQLLACFRQAVGHDLPNQLIAIQGLLNILALEETERLSPDGQEYLQRLLAATERAHALVSSLAELGRIRSNNQRPEMLSLKEVAQEVAARLNHLYSGRTIEYDWPEPAFHLEVPRLALEQVLLHLMRNAVQAARDDLPIRIEVHARAIATQREFWITDNGRGLTTEQLHQLRELFCGRTPVGLGEGLGLVLVRQYVFRWGGRLSVASEPGRGSTFTVTL
jgi:signal transduction histidine kinase